jgi:hypothetical protein
MHVISLYLVLCTCVRTFDVMCVKKTEATKQGLSHLRTRLPCMNMHEKGWFPRSKSWTSGYRREKSKKQRWDSECPSKKKGGIVSGMVQSVMLSSFIYSGATWFIVLSLRFADRNSHILTLDSKYIPTLADWFFLFIMACIFPKSVTFIMAYIQLTLCLNESSQIWTLWPVITPLDFVKITSQTFGMFGLRNKLFIIYSFLTFFCLVCRTK